MKNRIMRFLIHICIVLSCCTLAACSDNEEKWEPEIVVPLATLEVDISQYFPMVEFTSQFFDYLPPNEMQLTPDVKTLALIRAIQSLDSLDLDKPKEESVREKLPIPLRSEMDFFETGRSQKTPQVVLGMLLSAFQEQGYYHAINRFAWEIVAEAVQHDSTLKPVAESMLTGYCNHVDTFVVVSVNIGDFSEINQARWIKLQFFIASRLNLEAKIQVDILSADSTALDNFEYRIPIRNETGESLPPHSYEGDEAKNTVQSLGHVSFRVSSDSLGLTFDKIKDLHERKIRASMGLMIKMAINDNDAGK
ncbi:MAG: hypothetical protein LBB79_01585 [Prevotellaceae bacterium]|jgi:hypothetical protein|nr:hypothetical protein [Prevotellaceae bacterium]